MIISNSNAGTLGGVFYYEQVAAVSISDSTFTTFSAGTDGSLMYSKAVTLVLTVSSSISSCLSTPWDYVTDL